MTRLKGSLFLQDIDYAVLLGHTEIAPSLFAVLEYDYVWDGVDLKLVGKYWILVDVHFQYSDFASHFFCDFFKYGC